LDQTGGGESDQWTSIRNGGQLYIRNAGDRYIMQSGYTANSSMHTLATLIFAIMCKSFASSRHENVLGAQGSTK
jgi:hypothetical protein